MDKKYKHKKSGIVVSENGDSYIRSNECMVPSSIVENSDEWELIEEMWEMLIKENKELYFKSTFSGIEFHIGDKVTIKSHNMSFGDGVRHHKIKGFNVVGWGSISSSLFKQNIRVSFECYDANDRTLQLDEIVKI
jgi:hypothetical protein